MGTEFAHRNARPGARSAVRAGRGRAAQLAARLGTSLAEGRRAVGLTQAEAGARAGISQPGWSQLERGHGAVTPLATWAAAAAAVGEQLVVFFEGVSGAGLPRDVEHLRRQEAVIRATRPGGWVAYPEAPVVAGDRPRSIDVLLVREPRREAAIIEIWDTFTDVGASLRTTDAKSDAIRARLGDAWRVSACWVVRGTRRNRDLLRSIPALIGARFPVRPADWLAAFRDPGAVMPCGAGLISTTVAGDEGLALAPHVVRGITVQ